MVTQTLA